MKQILFILISGLISFGDIYAQDLNQINYQLDFGTTLTIPYKNTIEIWPEINDHPQTNYNYDFGYFIEFFISNNLSAKYEISTGFNYTYNSLNIEENIGVVENKGILTSSYLKIPVLFKYRLSDKLPISLSAGPYFSLLVNANEIGTTYIDTSELIYEEPDPVIESINSVQKYDNDIKKNYTSIDYGFSIQFDYEIPISKKLNGVILSRFNYGLKDIIINELENKNLANDWKNCYINIGFGLKLLNTASNNGS